MKSYIHKYFFIPMFLLLSGACKVSRDVAVPSASLPAAYRNATDTADTGTIADMSWKTFFTDPSLQKLIDQAISKNYDMQLAVKNLEVADQLYRQVKWNYVPDLRLQIAASSVRPSDNSLNGISLKTFLGTTHIEDFNASIGLSWEADIWSKIRNQKRRALAVYLQTEEAKKAIQTNIVINVARGYYNLAMLDAQLKVAKRNLALNDSTLLIMKLQFDAGQITSLAVEQAQAQQLVAAQLIPLLEQNIAVQENALSILTGNLPARTDRETPLESIVLPQQLPVGFPSAMVSRRPDVRSSELALMVANANVGISKANMYPALSITAAGGVNAFKADNWFTIPASLFGTVAGNIVQPLINRKQLKTQYKVSKIEREKTVLQFRQTVLYAVGEVSDALVKLEKLKTQYEMASQRAGTLRRATTNANMLFQSGMANYLEVITAQANALQSELDMAAIRRDQLITSADLYRSLGGGWK